MKIICNFSFLYILSNFYTGGIYIFPPQQTLRVTLLERQRSAHNWDKAERHWLQSVWSCYFTWIRKQMNLLWTSLSSWIMLYLTFKHTLNYLLHFLLISGHLKIGTLKKNTLERSRFCINIPFSTSMRSIHFKDILHIGSKFCISFVAV